MKNAPSSELLALIRLQKASEAIEAMEANDSTVVVAGKRKMARRLDGRWFMGFVEAMAHSAKNPALKGNDLRVLNYLISIMDFENWIKQTQADLARELNMNQPQVAVSINRLVEQNYLLKEKRGRYNIYRINANVAWKGKASMFNQIVSTHPKLF